LVEEFGRFGFIPDWDEVCQVCQLGIVEVSVPV
jgi:hypothetical protein